MTECVSDYVIVRHIGTDRVTEYVSYFEAECPLISKNVGVLLADNFSVSLCNFDRRSVSMSVCVRVELCDSVRL